jgi:hypothetical protein
MASTPVRSVALGAPLEFPVWLCGSVYTAFTSQLCSDAAVCICALQELASKMPKALQDALRAMPGNDVRWCRARVGWADG